MNISRKLVFGLIGLLGGLGLHAQEIKRADPPYWWQSMPQDTLEILFSGQNLAVETVELTGGTLLETRLQQHSNYLWVQVLIEQGATVLDFSIGKLQYNYALKARSGHEPAGLSPADLVYLIVPDRFCNGDSTNDRVPGMLDQTFGREDNYYRQGGDLVGIASKSQYLESLGVSALWMTPVLENNMERDSYHGYAITDHYNVDPRFGGHNDLVALNATLKAHGIKAVADVVYNHWGSNHYLMNNLPEHSMIHWDAQGHWEQSSFRLSSLYDPSATQHEKDAFTHGWFAGAMPDLNQDHWLVESYLIYHSIWLIEAFSYDAFRVDTYPFSEEAFLAKLGAKLHQYYPSFYLFGETWTTSTAGASFFTSSAYSAAPDGITDFSLWDCLHKAYTADGPVQKDWNNGGAALLYNRLAEDFLFGSEAQSGQNLVVFIDNHDDGRFLGQMELDTAKLISAATLLYQLRGVPVLLYGTEVGLSGHQDHGAIREMMPWDRTTQQNALLQSFQELGAFRKQHHTAALSLNSAPGNGLWKGEKTAGQHAIDVIYFNATDQATTIALNQQDHPIDLLTGEEITSLQLQPWEVRIIRIQTQH